MFDRKTYFDHVRHAPFKGSMTQGQVDGQEWLLTWWEERPRTGSDLRFLAYPLATTYHETAATMQPIEEYGKGAGYDYGKPDPETGQTYYGRGYVQLTWRDNYRRATEKLGLSSADDLEWHAGKALDPMIAADVLFHGMSEGWFTGKKLSDYFTASTDDPVNARAIINNDVGTMGKPIANYHANFLDALKASSETVQPDNEVKITIELNGNKLRLVIDGVESTW